MAYSLLTSINFAFWLTTSTGSVNTVPPPVPAPVAPAFSTSRTTFSVGRLTVGGGAEPTSVSTPWRPWDATCSVQPEPSQYRCSWRPDGSGHQPGSGAM